LTGKKREKYLAKQRRYQHNHYLKRQAEKRAQQDAALISNVTDITGEAAKAILLAAKVIRGTAQALKLP
jgi:hypothetical protein